MSREAVGIGLIGCGSSGRHAIRALLARDERLCVRGICDPDSRSIQAAREEIGTDVTVYDDYHALVQEPNIDWVIIASWNCFHRAHATAALQAGKDVFCQKPLATNLEDCLAIRDIWHRSGRMFNIGFTLRYSPHYRTIRKLVSEGHIGEIVSLEFNEHLGFNHGGYIMGDWRRLTRHAGTHLLEKCCHDIDLVNWFVGSRASRVASFGGLDFFIPAHERHMHRLGLDEHGRQAYRTWNSLVGLNPFTSDKDVIDNQVVIIEYQNRVRATFHMNANSAIPERRMLICGTEGTLRADVISGNVEFRRIGFGTLTERMDAGVSGGHGGGDEVLVSELASSMLEGAPPSAGLEEGLASAVTCFAIDEAMRSGTVVDLVPFWEQVDTAAAR